MAPINVLIMATGSIASCKLPVLVDRLQKISPDKYCIKVALTEPALHFFHIEEIQRLLPEVLSEEASRKRQARRAEEDAIEKAQKEEAAAKMAELLARPDDDDDDDKIEFFPLSTPGKSFGYKSPFDKEYKNEPQDDDVYGDETLVERIERKTIFRDADEWSSWRDMGDPVLHIVLRNWADIGVIAPLDANTLGKLYAGMCDNLITCTLRAWDPRRPLLYAPAMNTNMWTHPLTARNMKVLDELNYIRVGPISKLLACGDVGFGAMAEVGEIVEAIEKAADGLEASQAS